MRRAADDRGDGLGRTYRIRPTRKLAELAARSPSALRAFVTASAVGIYGPDRGDEILAENSDRGDGFLADVVTAWEEATAPAAMAAIRTVQVRTGIVQTPRGGVLRMVYPLFAAGLGGLLGDGAQWFAWIGIDDLLDIYLRAVTDRALGRPAVLPVPAVGPRLLLGSEGASELAGASHRVRPAVLAAAGHQFRYPGLEGALRHVLGRDPVPAATAKVAMAPDSHSWLAGAAD